MSTNPSELSSSGRRMYSVGTLRYTFGGLVTVFFWLLFGDFTLVMMEQVMPKIVPLTLRDFHASNATMGVLVGSIGAALNMILNPIISYRSDRHRSPLGRRIPYLLWPSPFIAAALIWVGFSPELGQWLYRTALSGFKFMTPAGVVITMIGVAIFCFQCFNLFVASVYYYLFYDVVPAPLLGRFYGLFRVVGAAGGFVFNRWVLGLADHADWRKWIYVAAGALYLISFTLICLNVREGEYPPPDVPERAGLPTAVRTYARECFSQRFYWWYFGAGALYVTSHACSNVFYVFFAQDLGMNLGQYGKMLAWCSILAIMVYYPLGWLADKMHPLRMNLVSGFFVLIAAALGAWLIHGIASFWWITIFSAIAQYAYAASAAPLDIIILPREKYGQFASASAMVKSVALLAAGYLGGKFIDVVHEFRARDYYRSIFWWEAFFCAGAMLMMLMVYWYWKTDAMPTSALSAGSGSDGPIEPVHVDAPAEWAAPASVIEAETHAIRNPN